MTRVDDALIPEDECCRANLMKSAINKLNWNPVAVVRASHPLLAWAPLEPIDNIGRRSTHEP